MEVEREGNLSLFFLMNKIFLRRKMVVVDDDDDDLQLGDGINDV